ncbi:DUF2795 domain-containing protein [Cupriavidus taiwanensis]|uniref:DUF2795 domain-containing protein n=1 Tax=Cupriavidus taiwanensis TaxID=164546 RepID=A0A7Z7JE62_9BURK|nr:DUF2795 domain-containing protein [Cupriavidus taiwanensis]SOY59708.1 conserved hypothetical protein [Cupriavidus taiwanensis]SOZ10631.1 conserved hypothetical protein [Cupriavidus taiwanensis]SOZ12813.1 conserved hypothetical protein [Cupriavidus taiwanensis]SOZ41307.1 conserved hypothetical protein [Cupriavidus taiwanensis]SPC23598.1 conserved hypothetical protein [Cupriavidus taiwanensis]
MANDKRPQGNPRPDRWDPDALGQALRGLDYPATRGALISTARDNAADDAIVDALMGIPEQNYRNAAEVSEAVARQLGA